ncbi:hypothetical protein [Sporosarcina sp. ITBMC105]
MDLSTCLEGEGATKDLKQSLLNLYQAQEELIIAQQEAVMCLLNENMEQEVIIEALLKGTVCLK